MRAETTTVINQIKNGRLKKLNTGVTQSNPNEGLMPIYLERELIQSTLEQNGGDIIQTANDLGLSRRGLQLKIKSLDINVTEKNDNEEK